MTDKPDIEPIIPAYWVVRPYYVQSEQITIYGESINLTEEQEQRFTKDILESLRKVAKQ